MKIEFVDPTQESMTRVRLVRWREKLEATPALAIAQFSQTPLMTPLCEQLRALPVTQLPTALLARRINEIIGNKSWTTLLQCTSCRREGKLMAEISSFERDWTEMEKVSWRPSEERYPILLCLRCAGAVHSMFPTSPTNSQKGENHVDQQDQEDSQVHGRTAAGEDGANPKPAAAAGLSEREDFRNGDDARFAEAYADYLQSRHGDDGNIPRDPEFAKFLGNL